MKPAWIAAAVAVSLSAGCAPQAHRAGVGAGFDLMGEGIARLVLAPFQIVAGLAEGLLMLPHVVHADLHSVNRAMVEAGTPINLEDTYEYAYDRRLAEVDGDGHTGVVFRRMSRATEFFQRLIGRYGVPGSERYLLVSVKTANDRGYTLYAVVRRDRARVDVRVGQVMRQIGARDRLFYEPVERDTHGQTVDEVVDWVGVPRTAIATQKGQAMLMTLAANAVVADKRRSGFWDAHRRWIAGDHLGVVREGQRYLAARMATAALRTPGSAG